MRAHQRVFVIQLRAGEQVEAHRVDEYFGACRGDDQVVFVLRIGEVTSTRSAFCAGSDARISATRRAAESERRKSIISFIPAI